MVSAVLEMHLQLAATDQGRESKRGKVQRGRKEPSLGTGRVGEKPGQGSGEAMGPAGKDTGSHWAGALRLDEQPQGGKR